MLFNIKALTNRIRRDESGQFAVVTALIGLPLIMIAGFSVDFNKATHGKSEISAALDSAALAAVIPANMDVEARKKYAQTMFEQNYLGDLDVKVTAAATRERVELKATAKSNSLFGGILGIDGLNVAEDSTAVLTKADVVCVLALDPDGAKAIEFRDFAQFSAPACSVQANSTHAQALSSSLSKSPTARSFCSVGESYGVFAPIVKHACTPIADPFANLAMPRPIVKSIKSMCSDGDVDGDNSDTQDLSRFDSDGENRLIADATLKPGVYCEGLKIVGANVRFEPGIYHLWGDMKFTSYAGAVGENVTFIIKGTDNKLEIENGAQVSLKAPATGPTAGLVFWQYYTDMFSYILGRQPTAPESVTGTSKISSGGGLKLVGTAYFPTQELVITSNSPTASESPATSIIAYRVEFGGRSNMTVNVDHEKGGIPPMLPRSDEGARLVK